MFFDEIRCCDCAMSFGVPVGHRDKLKESTQKFWCPNGHPQSYTVSTLTKVERERDLLRQQMAQKDDEIAEQKKLILKNYRAKILEIKKNVKLHERAKAGLCLCCNRHFTNLERHMGSKHEGQAKQEAEVCAALRTAGNL